MTMPPDLSRPVAELRAITADHAQPRRIIALVRPLTAGLAPDPARADHPGGLHQGWRYLLDEEPDHAWALFAHSWPRGATTPPHTHGTRSWFYEQRSRRRARTPSGNGTRGKARCSESRPHGCRGACRSRLPR